MIPSRRDSSNQRRLRLRITIMVVAGADGDGGTTRLRNHLQQSVLQQGRCCCPDNPRQESALFLAEDDRFPFQTIADHAEKRPPCESPRMLRSTVHPMATPKPSKL